MQPASRQITYARLLGTIAGLLVLAGCVASSARGADWPTYRCDNRRSGVSLETPSLPMKPMWVRRSHDPPSPSWPQSPAKRDILHRFASLSPTVVYDRAYHLVVAGRGAYYGSSSDDTVYCLDAATGRVRWSFIAGGPVRSAPTVVGDRVLFGSDDGRAYCLNAADGSVVWTVAVGPNDVRLPGNGRLISLWPVRSGVVVEDGVAYCAGGLFPEQGVYLCAIDLRTGGLTWRRKVRVPAQGYMLATPSRLFVPTGRTPPQAFQRVDGKRIGKVGLTPYGWLGGGGTFAVVLDDMLVHGTDEHGKMHFSEPRTRERLISTRGKAMLADQGMLYVLDEKSLRAIDRKRYTALARRIGPIERKRWYLRSANEKARLADLTKQRKACVKWRTACSAPYALILAGDVLFAGSDKHVVAFDAGTGQVRWRAAVDDRAYGLAFSEGRLYVSTGRGTIYCFGAAGAPALKAPVAGAPEPAYPPTPGSVALAKVAERAIGACDVAKGYCLVLGSGTGRLVYEIARRSSLRVVGVEPDARLAEEARRRLKATGLYGRRVAIHHAPLDRLPYVDCVANLVVLGDSVAGGSLRGSASEALRVVRPTGGALVLGVGDTSPDEEALRRWGMKSPRSARRESGVLVLRRGPLPGAGVWTHALGDVGNTACSGDTRVGGKMRLQWFGPPGPARMIDRHHRNVPPLYEGGRLFAPGDNLVIAIDAYNGTVQWERAIPDSRRLGVFLDCGSMAIGDGLLYVVAKDRCYGFDVATGSQRLTHWMPQAAGRRPHHWGYLARSGDLLVGSGRKPNATYTRIGKNWQARLWRSGMKVVLSDYLFAMDPATGKTRWTYDRPGVIVNPTIALGGDRAYFVESESPAALADTTGRLTVPELFDGGQAFLSAVDLRTGECVYRKRLDPTHLREPVFVSYSAGVVLLSGGRAVGRTVHYSYYAFDAATGEPRWTERHDSGLSTHGGHGEFNRHATIVGSTVYAWPYAYDLATGARRKGWKFSRRGAGCGGVSASAGCLFWRGGAIKMRDLPGPSKARVLTTVARPGCWINVIPAGGLVLAPEASAGCTCAVALQTSMAFMPTRDDSARPAP